MDYRLVIVASLAISLALMMVGAWSESGWDDSSRVQGVVSIADWQPSISGYSISCGCPEASIDSIELPTISVSYTEGYTGPVCVMLVVHGDTSIPIYISGARVVEGGSLEEFSVSGPFTVPPEPSCPGEGEGPVIVPPDWYAVVWIVFEADGSGMASLVLDYGVSV